MLTANSSNPNALKLIVFALTGLQISKIWPYISEEIPFHFEFHQNSFKSISEKVSRELLASLLSIALNEAQRAPKIPQNWLENQPNDHTSTFLYSFSILSLFCN
jgi:hypothetical protein